MGSNVFGLTVYCAAMIVIVGALVWANYPDYRRTSNGKTVPSDSYRGAQLGDYERVLIRDYGRVLSGKNLPPSHRRSHRYISLNPSMSVTSHKRLLVSILHLLI